MRRLKKEEAIGRIARLTGQLRGLQSMVEEDRDCVDCLTQISAARNALDSLAGIILHEEIECFVTSAAKSALDPEDVTERVVLLRQAMRLFKQ